MNHWRLLITDPAHGAWNMAADEAILEHVGNRQSLSTLRLYSWVPPCLSLGQAQPFSDVDTTSLHQHGWDVVRRLTGGRAILHTDEITYSIIAPPDEPLVAGTVLESYNRISQALIAAVCSIGLPVEVKEHQPGLNTNAHGPVCFEVPSAYEITVHGKKLIGSAQARKRQGVLQHGSLPLNGDLTRVTQALRFPDETTRQKAGQRLLERATTVRSVLGRKISWETAKQAIIEAFVTELGLSLETASMSAEEKKRTVELVREKYAHSSWTERI
ncbi:MAG: lipoate--protein ligase family protein [Anaerolineales bacterium]|nr:lipoate--protein ligase family protein [Anaerolineales bacterium]